MLLILTGPLTMLAMPLIKLEDGRSIFYHQHRTDMLGHPVTIKKLRTMRLVAENEEGAHWAQTKDQRVTKVGWRLRHFRIDELPQLWSVLSGVKSLIGPRPERPELELELETKIAYYRLRYWLRPGLSGWAQVCFPYEASTRDSRIKLSQNPYYMRNANKFLDLLILLKTVRLVANAKGTSPRKNKKIK